MELIMVSSMSPGRFLRLNYGMGLSKKWNLKPVNEESSDQL